MSNALYEPLIGRELERVPEAVRAFRGAHSSEELWQAVTRFAILAYAPSQHAKHAVLACLAAWEVRDLLGERFDDWMIACARYAAASRQPWSEPPIMDPPEPSSGDVEELRGAIADGDRLGAERWLAARLQDDDDLARDLFLVATDDFEDFGHKLIVARAAWKLAALLGEKGRFVTLRTAVWELTAYRGARYEERGDVVDVERIVASLDGGVESMHHLYLYDAARGTNVESRVADYLASAVIPSEARDLGGAGRETPVPYNLARDYASYLKAHAVAERLPSIRASRIVAAARHNLDHGSSFEDLPFA
jgi:hypothetical protein